MKINHNYPQHKHVRHTGKLSNMKKKITKLVKEKQPKPLQDAWNQTNKNLPNHSKNKIFIFLMTSQNLQGEGYKSIIFTYNDIDPYEKQHP